MLKKLIDVIKRLLSRKPKVADATELDHMIVPTDNSGEDGQPVESQDPSYIPRGVAE